MTYRAVPVLSFLLVPAIAAAQGDSTALPRVVITATRVASPVGAGIAASTVLDAAALQARGVHSVAEALRHVPGAALVRSGGPGAQASLFLRGGESDYVRVLVDGVAVNDPGGAIDLASFTLDNVERIEVVRGPASVLYGSDAVTGVVQIFTRRGSTVPVVDAALEAASYGGRAALLSSAGAMGPLSATAAYAHRASDGVLPFNNGYRNDVLSASLSTRSARGGRVSLSARSFDDRYHYPTDGGGAITDRNAFRGDRRSTLSLEAGHPMGSFARVEATLAAADGRGRTDDRADGPADTLGFFAYRNEGSFRRRVADVRVHLLASRAGIATVGAEWVGERQESRDSSNYDAQENTFRAKRDNRAVYAQWVGEAGRLQYSAGARHDDNTVFGTFRTARVGAALDLWPGGTLRASAGSAFKAPTFTEQFNTAFSVGNPTVRPERSRSAELGLSQASRGGRLVLAATLFRQRFRDLIQFTWIDPATANYFNVAAASSRGLELEVRSQVTPRLAAMASATLLRTRVEDAGFDDGEGATFVHARRLLRRPSHTASLGLVAQATSRLSLNVQVLRVGERDDRDFGGFPALPVVLAPYTRADAGASYVLPPVERATFTLVARAENVMGTSYEELANFRAPGRIVSAGLRMNAR